MVLLLSTLILAILGVAALLWLRGNPRAGDLVALCLGLLITAYMAEALLAAAAKPRGFWPAFVRAVKYDTRSRAAVVQELRNRGESAAPQVIPSAFIVTDGLRYGQKEYGQLMPLAGPSLTTTVFCNEYGEWVSYRSDERGFRNPPGLHSLSLVDIVVLGDSFAHGQCVPEGDDISAFLRHQGWSTVNLGTSGKGPLLTLASFAEYAVPLRPSVVLWVFFEGNDLEDLRHEKKSELLMQYLDPTFSQGLSGRQDEIDARLADYVDSALNRKLENIELRKKARAPLRRLTRFLSLHRLEKTFTRPRPRPLIRARAEHLDPLFSEILRSVQTRTESWGGRVLFVYLSRGEPAHLEPWLRDEIFTAVDELGIPIVDFHQILAEQRDVLSLFPLRLRRHYNSEGYRLLSQAISARLDQDPNLYAALTRNVLARRPWINAERINRGSAAQTGTDPSPPRSGITNAGNP